MDVDVLVFDFDDTLVNTYPLFLAYYDRVADAMIDLGFSSREAILDYLHAADIAAVTRIGRPVIESFPLAIRDTYRHFCAESGRVFQSEVSAGLEKLGWTVHEEPAELAADAEMVLSELQKRKRLLLLSQGDEKRQLQRILRSGVHRFFEDCIVVPLKTEDVYRQLAQQYGIYPHRACMIGNSIRSDINPALAAGFYGIHIKLEDWAYDCVESRGDFLTIHHLPELLRIV